MFAHCYTVHLFVDVPLFEHLAYDFFSYTNQAKHSVQSGTKRILVPFLFLIPMTLVCTGTFFTSLTLSGVEEGEENEIIIKTPQEDLLEDEWPEDVKLPLCELCVWVDPLDGTKEFTEGRYEYVSTLIGISCQGHPVAGIISEPYRHWAFSKSIFL